MSEVLWFLIGLTIGWNIPHPTSVKRFFDRFRSGPRNDG